MTRRSPWPWLVLVVWCAWIYALAGRAAAEPSLDGWVPDLGLVLLLALEPRLAVRDALRVALLIGLARLAFSADPPPAVFAGLLFAVFLSRALRSFVEVDGIVVRALLAGVCALLAGLLSTAAHLARAGRAPGMSAGGAVPFDLDPVMHAAVATGLAALFLGPALRRLPGLSPFVRRRGVFA